MQTQPIWNTRVVAAMVTAISRNVLVGAMTVGLGLAGAAGCARVSTENVMMRGPGLPKPELIIVHDYAASRDEVQLDSGIGSRLERIVKGTPEEHHPMSKLLTFSEQQNKDST